MLFDRGNGYSPEVPEGYEMVFDRAASERYPSEYRPVFFLPGQPTNTWGEPSITWHQGRFYMWNPNWGKPTSRSLYTSTDGVYWREEGMTFLPDDGFHMMGESEIYRFDPSGPFVKIYNGIFKMPDGSAPEFPDNYAYKPIMFATSSDLVNWKRLGRDHDFKQDTRWYNGRWDSFFVLPDDQGGWMTVFNSGIQEGGKPNAKIAFATSRDGMVWQAEAPLVMPSCGEIEISAWRKIGLKYFLLHDLRLGLWVTPVLVAEDPRGPYRHTKRNNLISNSPSVYDKIYDGPHGELLAFAECHVHRDGRRFSYIAPFKQVECDGDNLWYRWWPGNDALKAQPISLGEPSALAGAGGHLVMLDHGLDLDQKTIVLEGDIDFTGVRPFQPGRNLATSATVSASDGGENASAAVDGDLLTGWAASSEYASKVHYTLDFGKVEKIGRLEMHVLLARNMIPRTISVEESPDGVAWSPVAQREVHGGFTWLAFEGLQRETRYLRVSLELNKWAGRYGCGIQEIKVYQKPKVSFGTEKGSLPGLFFECEGGIGEAVLFDPAGKAYIGLGMAKSEGTHFRCEIEREIRTPPRTLGSFRIIQSGDLVEVYFDEYQLHIINHRKPPTGRIGFITSGGENRVSGLKAWYADPEVASGKGHRK
jgi:hypothetical protein